MTEDATAIRSVSAGFLPGRGILLQILTEDRVLTRPLDQRRALALAADLIQAARDAAK